MSPNDRFPRVNKNNQESIFRMMDNRLLNELQFDYREFIRDAHTLVGWRVNNIPTQFLGLIAAAKRIKPGIIVGIAFFLFCATSGNQLVTAGGAIIGLIIACAF